MRKEINLIIPANDNARLTGWQPIKCCKCNARGEGVNVDDGKVYCWPCGEPLLRGRRAS